MVTIDYSDCSDVTASYELVLFCLVITGAGFDNEILYSV